MILLWAWLQMLLLGAMHEEISVEIPAISYFGSLMVSLFIYIAGIQLGTKWSGPATKEASS